MMVGNMEGSDLHHPCSDHQFISDDVHCSLSEPHIRSVSLRIDGISSCILLGMYMRTEI